MFEQIIYFFRKKPYFFYSFLIVFVFVYSILLGGFFLESSSIKTDIFIVLIALSLLWMIAFYFSFKQNLKQYKFEREREKFELLEDRIVSEFDLNDSENIFKKIEAVRVFVKKNFSDQSLASIRILSLINRTLFLYLDNLDIIKNLAISLKALSDPVKKFKITKKIEKNKEQNSLLLDYLDSYINELAIKNENDKEVLYIKIQLENMLEVLKNINKK